MTRVTLKEFIDLIKDNIIIPGDVIIFRIRVYDDNIFSVSANREVIYLDVPEENKYDILFETLKEEFAGRYITVWIHDICGHYEAAMIIDDTVIIELDYTNDEGQRWLYMQNQ